MGSLKRWPDYRTYGKSFQLHLNPSRLTSSSVCSTSTLLSRIGGVEFFEFFHEELKQ